MLFLLRKKINQSFDFSITLISTKKIELNHILDLNFYKKNMDLYLIKNIQILLVGIPQEEDEIFIHYRKRN